MFIKQIAEFPVNEISKKEAINLLWDYANRIYRKTITVKVEPDKTNKKTEPEELFKTIIINAAFSIKTLSGIIDQIAGQEDPIASLEKTLSGISGLAFNTNRTPDEAWELVTAVKEYFPDMTSASISRSLDNMGLSYIGTGRFDLSANSNIDTIVHFLQTYLEKIRLEPFASKLAEENNISINTALALILTVNKARPKVDITITAVNLTDMAAYYKNKKAQISTEEDQEKMFDLSSCWQTRESDPKKKDTTIETILEKLDEYLKIKQ
jgi:hypothetical protein